MTVRELRKKLGWSQMRMASEVGVHIRSVSNWELYGRWPDANHVVKLQAIAKANGIDGFAPNCPCCGRPL